MIKYNHNDPNRASKLEAFDRLLTIMDELREQCPWDKKQTLESLRHLSIEEIHELADAILSGNNQEIEKELGDILLHIVFYARIGSETGRFDISSVIHKLCDKLIHRHPHIYGDVKAETEDEVKANWEQLKLKEKDNQGVLAGVPRSLPSLVKAMRVQEKARSVGFDWEEKQQVWAKVEEELEELGKEISNPSPDARKVEGEFGDVLFALVNYARFIGVNADQALEKTNLKFISRFNFLEKAATREGKQLSTMSLEEMDVYWEQAKLAENSNLQT